MPLSAHALAAALAGPQPQPEQDASNYLHDLTASARAGKLSPVVGRDSEILQVLEVASQKRKANAVLIGPAGAGKTAVAEGLAQLCARHGQQLPEGLRGLRVLQLDVGAITAGAGVYGEIEKRMGSVLEAVRGPNTLLFVDELHTLVGAGGRAGHNDLAQWLKPHLARGDLRLLAATTAEEYHQIVARDAALERRFCPIYVQPMSDTAALLACESHARWLGLQPSGLHPNGLRPVLRQVVLLARRLLRHRAMPDAAIDLLERSAAMARLASQPLHARHVRQAATRLLQLDAATPRRLARLPQQAAVRALPPAGAQAVARGARHLAGLLGLRQGRGAWAGGQGAVQGPCLLEVAGPPALGQQVAELLAQALGSGVVAVDGLAGEREVYGAEPGYVGHGQRRAIHRLQEVPFSVVHLRHAEAPAAQRLLADLRAGAVTDAEGRCMAVHVAVLGGGASGGQRQPIGFVPCA